MGGPDAGADPPSTLPGIRAPGPAPAQARVVFDAGFDRAVVLADLLAGAGVERGLIGPREVPILWRRHLLNCALLADLLPTGARVVDIGSGAGLPGLVLAVRRTDLRVDLVEPMLRRTTFLQEAVDLLELAPRVRVVRGRAEDRAVRDVVGPADWVTARAVAPLDKLVRWCLPLLSDDGALLALKGSRAHEEVDAGRAAITSAGGEVRGIEQLGDGEDATWVVRVARRPQDRSRGRGTRATPTVRRS